MNAPVKYNLQKQADLTEHQITIVSMPFVILLNVVMEKCLFGFSQSSYKTLNKHCQRHNGPMPS